MERERSVIALGMFDGVHIGHRALVARADRLAREHDAATVAFTFSNHPASLFGGNVTLLTSCAQKEMALLSAGASRVESVPFTKAFAELSPDAFVAYLTALFDVCAVVCGFNYTFGCGGAGTADTLRELGRLHGFAVEVEPPVMDAGEPVSSSRVRRALQSADLDTAERLLGRPYRLTGTVEKNRGIGKRIGFPTANLDCGVPVPLPDGVYATAAMTEDGAFHAGVTNVGSNPTVDGTKRTLETHILEGTYDLYGKPLTVTFLGRLRGEYRFSDTAALSKRIAADAEEAKKVYALREKTVYNTAHLW